MAVTHSSHFEASPIRDRPDVAPVSEGEGGDVVPSTKKPNLDHITRKDAPAKTSDSVIRYESQGASEGMADISELTGEF